MKMFNPHENLVQVQEFSRIHRARNMSKPMFQRRHNPNFKSDKFHAACGMED